MQMSFINPARSITIGDDSGIGGDCLLFGHTSWLSQLEGYNVDFQPIEIGNSVSLSWRVFVLPGAKIGDGAVIGANSLVSHAIPPKCLAVGFPARVVSKFPDFPRDLSIGEKAGLFDDMIGEMIAFFRNSGLACEGTGPGLLRFQGGQARLGALPEMAPSRGPGVRRGRAGGPAGRGCRRPGELRPDRTGRKTETRRAAERSGSTSKSRNGLSRPTTWRKRWPSSSGVTASGSSGRRVHAAHERMTRTYGP